MLGSASWYVPSVRRFIISFTHNSEDLYRKRVPFVSISSTLYLCWFIELWKEKQHFVINRILSVHNRKPNRRILSPWRLSFKTFDLNHNGACAIGTPQGTHAPHQALPSYTAEQLGLGLGLGLGLVEVFAFSDPQCRSIPLFPPKTDS